MPSRQPPKRWDDLTSSRKRVASAVAFLVGPKEFTRNDVQNVAEEFENLNSYITEEDRLKTSLKYTTILNSLVDDHYLEKVKQGGQVILVIDYGPEGSEAVPAGDQAGLHHLAENVLKRNNASLDILEGIDFTNIGQVVKRVNSTLGKSPMAISADSSIYKMYEDAYSLTVSSQVQDIAAWNFRASLFNEYQSIDDTTPNHRIEATAEEVEEDFARLLVYEGSEQIDEIRLKDRSSVTEIDVSDAYDVIEDPDGGVLVVKNDSRTSVIQSEIEKVARQFKERSESLQGE